MCTQVGKLTAVPWKGESQVTYFPLWGITRGSLFQIPFHKTHINLVSLTLVLSCTIRSNLDNGFESSRENTSEKKIQTKTNPIVITQALFS